MASVEMRAVPPPPSKRVPLPPPKRAPVPAAAPSPSGGGSGARPAHPAPLPPTPRTPTSPASPPDSPKSPSAGLTAGSTTTSTGEGAPSGSSALKRGSYYNLPADKRRLCHIVLAASAVVALILIITLSVVLTRSNDNNNATAGLSAEDQAKVAMASATVAYAKEAFLKSVVAGNDSASGTASALTSGQITLSATTLASANFSSKQIANITALFAASGIGALKLQAQPIFCVSDAGCRSIDPDATCAANGACTCVAPGVSGFNCQYPAPSYVLDTESSEDNRSCSGSVGQSCGEFCEFDFEEADPEVSCAKVFGGFPKRKKMEATEFFDPDSDQVSIDSEQLEVDQVDVSFSFYATTTIFGQKVNVTVYIYVPSISGFPSVKGIALRFDLPSVTLAQLLKQPVTSTSWLSNFAVLPGSALVLASEAYDRNGYEIVQGTNFRVSLQLASGKSSPFMTAWNSILSSDVARFDMRGYIPAKEFAPVFEIALEPEVYMKLPSPVNDWLIVNHMEARVVGAAGSGSIVLSSKINLHTPTTDSSAKQVCIRSMGVTTFTVDSGYFDLSFIMTGFDWVLPYVSDVMDIHRVGTKISIGKTATGVTYSFTANLESSFRGVTDSPHIYTQFVVVPPLAFGIVTETYTNNQSPQQLICSGILRGNCPGVVTEAFNSINLNNVRLQLSIVAGAPSVEVGGLLVPNGVRVYTSAAFNTPPKILDALNIIRLGLTNQSSATFGIQVPFTNPTGVSIYVRYDNLLPVVNTSPPVFQFLFMQLGIKPAEVAVAVAGGFQLNFNSNPTPLIFTMALQISVGTGGGATLAVQGTMAGKWYNAFGVRGLDIADIVAQVGVTVPVTGTPFPSSVGAQGNITFGRTYVFFAMSVNPGAKQFYIAAQTPMLSLSEIIRFVLQTTQAPADLNIIVGILDVLEPIKVKDVDVLIAPVAYTQPETGVVIPQGFKIKGTIVLLLAELTIDMGLQQRTVSWWSSPINNFVASLSLATGAMTSWFRNVDFTTPVIQPLIDKLNRNSQLSFVGWYYECSSCFLGACVPPGCGVTVGFGTFQIDWTDFITSTTQWLSSAWAVASVSITNVDIMGMIDKANPINPRLGFQVTLPGATYSWSKTVDVNFFVNQQAAVVSAFISALSENAQTAMLSVVANFCNQLKSVCHTWTSPIFPSATICFDVRGIFDIC